MKHLLDLKSLEIEEINHILDEAEAFKAGKTYMGNKGRIVANLFFENSTRTHYSFMVAEEKLDMKVIDFAAATSSINKGESMYDTVKTFEALGVDALVIRATENEYYRHFIDTIKIPVLNAGDGTGNHPTQSLLDLMTIREEYGHFEGLKIAIVGDIKHSRVATTNVEVMTRLGMDVYTSGPKEYEVSEYRHIDFEKAVEEMDIIMLLRVQNERHSEKMSMSNEEYLRRYGLDMEKVKRMKEHAIIMHPAPFNRGVEIADDVAECDKARIFKQMSNGVFVRMAVLKRAMED